VDRAEPTGLPSDLLLREHVQGKTRGRPVPGARTDGGAGGGPGDGTGGGTGDGTGGRTGGGSSGGGGAPAT